MQVKKCFRCGRELPLDEFYKHPQMKDGHLNKCKDCSKKDAKSDYDRNSSNEEWMEKERERGREKFKRLNYKSRFRKTRDIQRDAGISKKLRCRGYDTKGKEAHHWNYNKPRSVFLLSRRAHKRIHLHMSVNYSDKYCYTEDGRRIESELQAQSYFQRILNGYGICENLKVINF